MGELEVDVALSNHFGEGGEGAVDLAHATVRALENPSHTTLCYSNEATLEDKAQAVVRRVYGGAGATFTRAAQRELTRLQKAGYGRLPVCIAKTRVLLLHRSKSPRCPVRLRCADPGGAALGRGGIRRADLGFDHDHARPAQETFGL